MGEERLVTRDFGVLVTGHLLQGLAWALMPLMPLYLEHLGATRAETGVIMASSAVGGLLLRPAVGWSLDALGRKRTLYAGTIFLVLGMALVWFVTDLGPFVYLVRVLIGIGAGTLFTAYFTYASDIIPERRRTEGIALFGISGLAPLAVGPFVYELGVGAAEVRWFFPLIGAVIALSFGAIALLPEPRRAGSAERAGLRATLKAVGVRPLWPVWLATAIFATAVATFNTFVVVTAESRGVDRPASMWLTYALGAIAVRLIGARLPDRLGPANIVAPALGLYTGALLVAAASWSTAGFVLAGLLAGLGHGYCFPVLTSQVVTRASARSRGAALSVFTGLWDLTAFTLTPLVGLIADLLDDATMFATAALFSLLGLCAWLVMEHRWSRVVPPSP